MNNTIKFGDVTIVIFHKRLHTGHAAHISINNGCGFAVHAGFPGVWRQGKAVCSVPQWNSYLEDIAREAVRIGNGYAADAKIIGASGIFALRAMEAAQIANGLVDYIVSTENILEEVS